MSKVLTMQLLPPLRADGYKCDHRSQYPKGTTLVYSNATCRGSRLAGVDQAVVFGPQYWIIEHLSRRWFADFFNKPLDRVMRTYKRRIDNYLGPGAITYDHIEALHKLGYLPLCVKSLPEGTLVPMRVPYLTIRNTHPDFFWLTNMLETNLSNVVWGMVNSATIAFTYRKQFEAFARKTGFPREMIKWMGHDFSYRGMFGEDAAIMSGMAHLLSFTGTDTIPAIDGLEDYYGANSDTELVGGSVPATEHSVMSMGGQESEIDTYRRLISEVYPKGIVSVVSDTWDYFNVLDTILPALREVILGRDGKLVIRPDSGDPVEVICQSMEKLWATFGGTVNEKGYKELDPHIGLIYGDSITLERQGKILRRLEEMGFASLPVLGIGSFTYQFNTRDTLGQAIKATYGEVNGERREIFKQPKTDDGTKNSARGLLAVHRADGDLPGGRLYLKESCSWKEEAGGELLTVFMDGEVRNFQTLAQIRARVEGQLC